MHSKHDMLVDVQDMRCVLAVYFTHFWPGRWACLLPLAWDIPCCGFATQTRGPKISACGCFHCICRHHIFSDMQRDCICDSCPPGPFLLIRNTMINLAIVCGLLRSCTSPRTPSVPLWCMCLSEVDRALFKVWCYRTILLTRQCLFRNTLLACCHVVVFVPLWKLNVGGGRSPQWTMGAHGERQQSKLNRKSIFIF